MPLDQRQLEQRLHAALLEAFPTSFAIEKMLRYRLDRNLAEIAASGSVAQIIFEIIKQFAAENRLDDLLTQARAENPNNQALLSLAAEQGLAHAETSSRPLEHLRPGATGILIDLSHEQSEWQQGSIFSAADGRLLDKLGVPTGNATWELRAVHDRQQLHAADLAAWRGLLLGMPHHERIDVSTRYELVTWVRGGGRLVLLGFELGERHHETNLNELAAEFGLRFNSDMVAPRGWSAPLKPYSAPIDIRRIQSQHPLLEGVEQVRLWNLCTVTTEPGADIVLTVADNSIARLKRDGVKYTSKGWLRGGRQEFETIEQASWVPIVAEAPLGLTGAGSVLAIGTWELFEPRNTFPSGFDNARLVANLFSWLASVDRKPEASSQGENEVWTG